MPEAYKGLQSRAVGTTRTKVGGYNVPASTAGVLLGLTLANITDGREVRVTVESFDGTNYTVLRKNMKVDVGKASELNDTDFVVLPTGYSLFVTSDAPASLDVSMSIKEIS